jgi:hypothetical protein
MTEHTQLYNPFGDGLSTSDDLSTGDGVQTSVDARYNSKLRRRKVEKNGFLGSVERPMKRLKSTRVIEMELPHKLFWNPRDPSTHHDNYLPISSSIFKLCENYAFQHEEQFAHGNKIFDFMTEIFTAKRNWQKLVVQRSARHALRKSFLTYLTRRLEKNPGTQVNHNLEVPEPCNVESWWAAPTVTIENNREAAEERYNQTTVAPEHPLAVYTNGSGINKKVGAAAAALATSTYTSV